MKPSSDITPRMFAVEFERPAGRLAFTVVLLALCPRHALDQVLFMFPGFRRAFSLSRVDELAQVTIDWEIGLAFVIKRSKVRPPMLLMNMYAGQGRTGGEWKGVQAR